MLGTKRSNNLIETIATVISFQVLAELGEKWAVEPPYENWLDYAPNFRAYRTYTLNQYISNLPEEVKVAVANNRWSELTLFLRFMSSYHNSNAIDSAESRALQHLGAEVLLQESIPWQELIGLAHLTVPSPTEDPKYRADLPLNFSQLSDNLLSVLKKVGKGLQNLYSLPNLVLSPKYPKKRGYYS